IGNYVRGKAFEILLVGLITYIVFVFLDLEYAILLATITGFSVLVPFIGAVAVAFPIALVAFVQFGWTAPFAYVMMSYGVIQILDGNVLVPWLFSEVNNLHPVAIIVAVLFFGGVWGFWGVFFAIPLATLVNAVIQSWPRTLLATEAE
ncbi:MAG: AI-2E family transporter, partial [Proteobacteria bacterium]